MDSGWLEDLIALVEADSLSEAAQARNVTQPAFSRRIQALEAYLGTEVLDRSRRPVRPTAMIRQHMDDIRLLSRSIDRLRNDLRRWEVEQKKLVVAALHSLAIAHLPRMVTSLQEAMPGITVRINAANWDECFTMLMTGQAMIVFGYETESLPTEVNQDMLEKTPVRSERLIPVASSKWQENTRLEIIAYPEEVFLGHILHGHIVPQLARHHPVSVTCEAALTPAVLELAIHGAGVAWVPEGMATPHIASGVLCDLSDRFTDFSMMIVMLRLKATRPDYADDAWHHILRSVSGF